MKYIDFNKRMIKPFIKIVSFLLVLAVVLEALSLTVFSKGAAANYANKYSNAYSYLNEPDNSIEIAGIGNSNFYSAFIPSKLWEQNGYTSTLVCAPRQSIENSYKHLQKLYETQSPKLVIVETDMFYRDLPDRDNTINAADEESALDTFFDVADQEVFGDIMTSRFAVFTFHDRWKRLFKGEKDSPNDPNSHGYHLSVKTKQFELTDYMKESTEQEKMKTADLDALNKFVKLCGEKGSQVMFLSVPSPSNWSRGRHNYVEALAKQYGVPFVDYNLLWKETGLDALGDFRDKGMHLNYDGAEKITLHLAKYLKANYQLDDLRENPEYGYWDESAKRFNSDVKKLRKREAKKAKSAM